jgi:hypothetical protein
VSGEVADILLFIHFASNFSFSTLLHISVPSATILAQYLRYVARFFVTIPRALLAGVGKKCDRALQSSINRGGHVPNGGGDKAETPNINFLV